jgi:modulator of FtsH protease
MPSTSSRSFPSIYVPTRARAVGAQTLLGQVMFLVAVAIGFLAGGSYIGRNLTFRSAEILEFVAIGMLFAGAFVQPLRYGRVGMAFLFATALVFGLGLGPVIANYAQYNRSALYQAAGGTALTVAAVGSYGFLTSRDLVRWVKPLFVALIVVIAASWILLLVNGGGNIIVDLLIYLLVSAYTAIYFQIIRRQGTQQDAVWIATGVFVNILNIFLVLLRIFGNSR